jgi:hypothetical protein
VANGVVYIGSEDGNMYSFHMPGGAAAVRRAEGRAALARKYRSPALPISSGATRLVRTLRLLGARSAASLHCESRLTGPSGRLPAQAVVVLADDGLAISGHAAHPGVRVRAEFARLVAVASAGLGVAASWRRG